ncbi:hypothetical protein [Shinella zoogloeoides]|jgi:hypothetical protein|uniref:hypothetical protein n=1 Tax=Shinella zoogloeoides TaxID=352475 RepID=UPI00147906D0|nr:hypothetical protein [Shinella zoogloeoides]UEX80853.1 hypothetical protein K8M09_14790 [Shinella zoogloeoides]
MLHVADIESGFGESDFGAAGAGSVMLAPFWRFPAAVSRKASALLTALRPALPWPRLPRKMPPMAGRYLKHVKKDASSILLLDFADQFHA